MTATQTKPSAHTVPTSDTDLQTLNSLLRGEISAVETYEQALGKFTDPAFRTLSNALTRLRDEHNQSLNTLRSRISVHGGEPAEGAGAWGVFANVVAGAAKLIGPQTVLAALKQGELHGAEDYDKALKDNGVSTESRYLIRNELLPRCHEHAAMLDGMIGQIEQQNQSKT